MKYLLFIILLSTTACADDAAFLSRLVVKFRVAANKWAPLANLTGQLLPDRLLKQIEIKLGEMGISTDNGYCLLSDDANPRIILNTVKWNVFNEWEREALVFHELGHCLLHRDHVESMVSRDEKMIPKSLMFPYLLSWETYLLNRDYYLEELFSRLFTTPLQLIGIRLDNY